ncbi:hypothetical protein BH23ACT3_BH23ACT3_10910 [soil metagenome]
MLVHLAAAHIRRAGRRFVTLTLATTLLAATLLAVDLSRPGAAPVQAEPAQPTVFEAIEPVRLTDTRRPDCGCVRLDDLTVRVAVAGVGDIPAEAVSAALTVTVTGADAPGFATVWPSGAPRRDTSNLNWSAGETRANGTIVELGVDGSVDVYVSTGTFVLVDVAGAFVPSPGPAVTGRFTSVPQSRLLDTRATGVRLTDQTVRVPTPSGVATDATALAVTVTVTDTASWGFVTAYPAGSERPDVSIVNADGPGQTRAATAVVPLGPGGLDLYVDGSTHLLVDVVGWFTGTSSGADTAGRFVSNPPTRLVDTRGLVDPIYPDGTRELELYQNVDVDTAGPVYTSLRNLAGAVVANITVTDTMSDGFLAAFPARTPRPGTSTINWTTDQTVANLTITPWSTAGAAYYAFSETDVIVDVTGYFTGPAVAATGTRAPNQAPGYTGESPYDLVRESVPSAAWAAVAEIEMRTVPALPGGAAGVAAAPPDRIAFARFIYQFRRSVARSVAAHEVGHILAWRWLRDVPGASEARVSAIGGHECLAEAIGRLLFAQQARFNYQPGYGATLIECSTSVGAGKLAIEIVGTTT